MEPTVPCQSRHPYLQLSSSAAEEWCLGRSTGTACPLSLLGWAACGKAPVGRRRTELQEDRSGAWGWREGEKKRICQHLKIFIFLPCETEMFGFALPSFKQQRDTANCTETEPHISVSLGLGLHYRLKKWLDIKYWLSRTCPLGLSAAFSYVRVDITSRMCSNEITPKVESDQVQC